MIIWQDDPFDGPAHDLEETLIRRARALDGIVLVHGDTHTYRLEKSWRQAPKLIELQTFAVEETDWWVHVTVDPARAFPTCSTSRRSRARRIGGRRGRFRPPQSAGERQVDDPPEGPTRRQQHRSAAGAR